MRPVVFHSGMLNLRGGWALIRKNLFFFISSRG